jgi:hypothetical protein
MRSTCLTTLAVFVIVVPPTIMWFNNEGELPRANPKRIHPDTSLTEGERAMGDPRTEPGEERPCEPVIGPEWKPAEESAVLPTGVKAHAAYHFNRNALSAACIAGDEILAVTDSGNLLRFDSKDLRLQQEARPDTAIALLAPAKGVGVLAACADGRVFRTDPKTLKQTEFAKLPAAPRWMAGFRDATRQQDGVLAVTSTVTEIELHRLGFGPPSSEKYELPLSGIDRGGVGVFFLDGKSRLWLGKDAGEWGGWCGSLDLNAGKAGKIETLEGHSQGVYGFVELPDGQVWAYGGTMHMNLRSAFIKRVDHGKSEELASFGSFGRERDDPNGSPKQPRDPITHVIPDPAGDGLLVFAYRDLFRVDTKLTNWRYLGGVELRYRWGRPDAIGVYPALRRILAAEGKSGDLICATARDGLLRIRDGRVTHYVVPGQIGDDRIDTILPTSDATLLHGEDLWRYTEGRWQATPLFPPARPSPSERWYECSLMLDPDRRPVSLCRSNSTPGSAALTRLKGGGVEILASQSGGSATFCARGGFATPDGSYWCADREELLRLVDGQWQKVGTAPEKFLWGFRMARGGKPPWILHCEGGLYRLTPKEGARDASLTPVPLPAELGTIHDALALEAGPILLACSAGLHLFDEKSGKASGCPFAPPGGEVLALCRDGRGRIWLAGSGLWMVDAKGVVHDLGKLTRYGAAQAIGADSADATGVIVALVGRGILFVRAEDVGR